MAPSISHNNEGFEVLDTKLKFYAYSYLLSSELTDFPSSFQEVKRK
jgi:hypothetical protein